MGILSTLVPLAGLVRNTKKTKPQIAKRQKKELYKMLMYAYEHSDYYRRVFKERGIDRENLTQTPITEFPTLDKQTLMAHFDELVTEPDLKQDEIRRFDAEDKGGVFRGKYHIVHSSGSTGVARYFVYEEKAWKKMLSGITRGALWGMSVRQILKLLAGKPRILYLAATDGRYGGAMAVGNGVENLGLAQKFLDINTPLTEWIKVVQKFQPDMIIGYPSAIKILGELAEQGSVKLHTIRIVCCGEPLSPGLMKYLERVFGAEVINFYGASESLALGVQSGQEDYMVLFDDLNYVEVIDGELYITVLYNYAQPLIRYHISDKLELLEGQEKDVYPFTKSNVLLSRDEDILWFQDAEGNRDFLHPLAVEGFCVDGLLDYQFRKTDTDAFEMRVEISDERKKESVKRELLQQLKQVMQSKHLEYVRFCLIFTDRIEPDRKTGKKQLIVEEERSMKTLIENRQFDEERALYFSQDCEIKNCVFAGPADGESVLKESRDVVLTECDFSLRYPLWHVKGFTMNQCKMDERTRAAIWYADKGDITDSVLGGIKAVRECHDIKLSGCQIVSPEFGWKSSDIMLENSEMESEYIFMDSRNVKLDNVKMKGKYSFQYMENLEIVDSVLDTKDAFWHSKNVTVRNSVVKGEYLAWFSDGLTLIDCEIIGTQPLCYCSNLKLINCTMKETDLAFEYSDVEADVKGHILSVKNPKSGKIVADSVGEIIRENPVMECTGEVEIREKSRECTSQQQRAC